MCACVCKRERECVFDFYFIFFYGHFGPKHPWTMGDNLTASHVHSRRIHALTIINFFFLRTYQGEDEEEAMKKATRLSLEVIQSLK